MQVSGRLIRVAAIVAAIALAVSSVQLVAAIDDARQVVVQPGDSLSLLGQKYGVSVSALMEFNGLTNPDLIRVGQVLKLPDATSGAAAVPAAEQVITVSEGDTLWSLSQAYGITVAELAKLNGIADSNKLAVGQRLTLPGSARPSTATAGAPPLAAITSAPEVESDVATAIEAAAVRHGVDPALALAVGWHVSNWNPLAGEGGVAQGVMQLSPATQEWVEVTLLRRPGSGDPTTDNIDAGVAYLRYLLDSFGDETSAVAAYLQGPAGVRDWGISDATAKRVKEIFEIADRLGAAPATSAAAPASQTVAVTAPAVAPEEGALQKQVEDMIDGLPEGVQVGLVAYNLNTGEEIWVNGDDIFPAASLLKVGIMATVYEQAQNGKLKLSEDVRNDLRAMLSAGDNEAANRLMDLVGPDRVNKVLASYGLTDTKLKSHFSLEPNAHQDGDNKTSASDMEFLLELMATDQLVSEEASATMRELLTLSEDGSKLLRPLPDGVRTEHKSGWYPGGANDVAVVYAPRATYSLAVLTRGIESDEEANALIAEFSRLIYQTWGE